MNFKQSYLFILLHLSRLYLFFDLVVANCGSLPNPSNGDVGFFPAGSTTFGAVAIYTCDPGFSLQGREERTCQADETWSGSEPKCVRKLVYLAANE